MLHEAHSHLGGRARSTDGPYIANDGAHAFYADGAPWRWLKERGLVQPFHALKPSTLARMRFRHEDRLRRLPPMPFNRMVTLGRRHRAPVEVSYRDWATGRFGPAAYRASLGFLRPVTFFHDPGSLSAAFCQERLHRVVAMGYPATRYPRGGWGAMIANMRRRAVGLGVRIETGSRVTALPEDGPVIVATSLEAARDLLGDPSLRWESGRVACRDLALPSGRDDTPCCSTWTRARCWRGSARPTRPSRRPAGPSSRATCRRVRTSPRPTPCAASTASTTRPCPAGGPGSSGAATSSLTTAPAPSTSRAGRGGTAPPSTRATAATLPATWSPPPASSPKSP
ncbi:hypothetical protein ACFQHO_02405 [Actinomadura yumaensis]|uniref:hypothetical protein n=1 Tax=Actinomadura yumaensis TaxID=111807 RepID=UPI00361A50EF